MPVYNYFTQSKEGQIIQDRALLQQAGPLINVEISIPDALADFYQKNKKPIPSPKNGWALIDTGAFATVIDGSAIKNLGIKAVGVAQVGTANGQTQQNKYPVHVKFPGTAIELDFNSVLSADLTGQEFDNTPIIALVGRDILSHCILVYNGITGMYTFAH